MRNIQRLIIFLFLISLCNAQTRVAVIDFDAKGVSEIEVSALTDRLRDELFKTGQYKVMERAMMEEILKEQGFQLSGCTSDECVIEIGKLIGVEQIIGGSISKVGNVFSVSSRMISVETSEVSRVANYDFTGDIGTLLTQGMKNAAIQLATGKAIESEQVIKIGEGTGILYITSEPSGSEVWVDDKKVEGTTPLIAENQPEGKHKIYFCKGDYTGEVEVDLQKDDLKKVNAILQLGYGNLKVITKPFEAIVTIDGEPAGKSPFVVKDLKAGTYKLSIYKNGYSPLSTEIFVKANQTVEFKEALQKLATVKIMSIPENATVIFDGEVIGSTPLTRETDSGIHILSISKTGYYTNELDVELKPDEKKELQINLEKHKGVLNITSKPSGAVVSINGETRGKTPITLDNLHIGNYQIKIEKSDYVTLEKNVTIEVDSIKSIHADFFKKPSFFTLNSDPSGAEIFIDGKNIGKSPVSKQISPGTYQVTVRMAEYYTKELNIELKPDEKKELLINLEKHKGGLNITSNPSETIVSINGETRGKTPITLDNLHIGNYQITIEKSDYVTLEKNVTIEVDSIKSIHADLLEKPSFFTLNSDPSGAEIFIDGMNIGRSPVGKQIAPGTYHVTVRMTDYYTKEFDIELKPDEKKETQINLKRHVGVLKVVTDPEGAKVKLDGKPIGNSPITVSNMLPGKYEVEIRKSNYLTLKKDVNIIVDKEKLLDFKLTESSFGEELQSLKMKKYVCLGAGILSSAAGAYFKYSSDKHYDEYLTAHDNATDLHDKIKLEDTIYPIAFGVGVACLTPTIYLHVKEILLKNKFNLSVTPKNDGITVCVGLEW